MPACAMHRNSTTFAARSCVFLLNFAQVWTPESQKVGAKRNTDSFESFADVLRIVVCRSAEFCMCSATRWRIFAFSREKNAQLRTPIKQRKLGAKRITASTKIFIHVLSIQININCTSVEFCMRAAPNFTNSCNAFARFLAKICAISIAEVAPSRRQAQ